MNRYTIRFQKRNKPGYYVEVIQNDTEEGAVVDLRLRQDDLVKIISIKKNEYESNCK